jgi:uncharacterized low-complexity protein
MLRKLITASVISVAGIVALTAGIAGAAKGGTAGRNPSHGSTVTTTAKDKSTTGSKDHGKSTSGTAKNNRGHATTTTTTP